ncbi:hypothetical protein EIK76_10640 [Rheinheimera mesophila]|uniref:Peptidase M15 n=1 Tax=Rheinheimera mesophila TaxID=1547515 RepID=A0A3P3QJU9_9GAMM|nr:hypothetical protein [Rheinheimera mesophila]RRJ21325.1 hypothetical protein EIK76_10640 [Rheinheimera mesophila]
MNSNSVEALLNSPISREFTLRDICHCGETWQKIKVLNIPQQEQSKLDLVCLATELLDPISEQFGKPVLTYGFAGYELLTHLKRKKRSRIAPKLDQHSASELNSKGELICSRSGAAVDLYQPSFSSISLALWISKNLHFDRLYYYGADKPIHLSYHREPQRQIVFVNRRHDGSVIPRRLSIFQLEQLAMHGIEQC